MLRVRDIMTPHVVTLTPDETLREAIDTLVTCRIGGAPVLDGERVVGVLSAPDVLEFEANTPVATIRSDDDDAGTMLEPAEEWTDGDESPSAFFTDLWTGDGPVATERLDPRIGPEWDFLEDHTVAEAMSRAVCTLPDNLEVSLAAQRMLALGAQRALVTEEGRLAGILTTTDVLRAVAERRLSVRQYVFD
ncbi:MAG TPA: CBS domain-containing protein [Gemmatimonadaceae bacterium]|nr:CBS domain-containing protein [Gemmatimonadaceae bacterium]